MTMPILNTFVQLELCDYLDGYFKVYKPVSNQTILGLPVDEITVSSWDRSKAEQPYTCISLDGYRIEIIFSDDSDSTFLLCYYGECQELIEGMEKSGYLLSVKEVNDFTPGRPCYKSLSLSIDFRNEIIKSLNENNTQYKLDDEVC